MMHEDHSPPKSLWAYGYKLAPPVPRDRMERLQAVLDAGQSEAELAAAIWEGRFINGDDITHILVVSDSPAQDGDINRRLEAELKRLEAGYSMSASLEILHD